MTFSLNVSVLSMSPSVAPIGKVGSLFSLTFVPSGGVATYSIHLTPGAVPGLTLLGSTISGRPTHPGIYPIQITLSDSAGVPNTLARIYKIAIDDALGEVPTLSVAPRPVTALYIQNSGNLPSVPVEVTSSSGTVPFDFSVLGIPASATGGTSTSASEQITLNPGTSPAGTYFGIAAAFNGQLSGAGNQAVNNGDATPILLTVLAAPPCSYTINPGALSVTSAGTGSSRFIVTAGAGCAWTAAPDNNSPWIDITNPTPDSGSGAVQFSVAQNAGQSERSGTIVISAQGQTQQTFTVTQFGLSCSFSLTPSTLNASANFNGGPISATITVNASNPACNWGTSFGPPTGQGLSVAPPASTLGSGQVTITIPVNGSGAAVNLSASVAGQTLNVNQAGTTCNVTLGTSGASYDASGAQGKFRGQSLCSERTRAPTARFRVLGGSRLLRARLARSVQVARRHSPIP